MSVIEVRFKLGTKGALRYSVWDDRAARRRPDASVAAQK
jgi:hypothetical protein